MARVHDTLTGFPSIHHADCEVIIDSQSIRCQPCTKHRKSLHAMVSQRHKYLGVDSSSHTTFANLNTPKRGMFVQHVKR